MFITEQIKTIEISETCHLWIYLSNVVPLTHSFLITLPVLLTSAASNAKASSWRCSTILSRNCCKDCDCCFWANKTYINILTPSPSYYYSFEKWCIYLIDGFGLQSCHIRKKSFELRFEPATGLIYKYSNSTLILIRSTIIRRREQCIKHIIMPAQIPLVDQFVGSDHELQVVPLQKVLRALWPESNSRAAIGGFPMSDIFARVTPNYLFHNMLFACRNIFVTW